MKLEPEVTLKPHGRLFSYVIRVDCGAAPNPYWGICTLAICKPAIRRAAQVDDWVMATGSARSPIGDIRGRLVYIMRVTDKMTMREYDRYCRQGLRKKIPKLSGADPRLYVGDCIYDFSDNRPTVRPGVHNMSHMKWDLRGENVLLSKYFFYFGNSPVKLPKRLSAIICSGQGHRSDANAEYMDYFLKWLHGQGFRTNGLHGKPQVRFIPKRWRERRCWDC